MVLSLHLCNRPFCQRYCFTATAWNHPANAFYQLWILLILTSSHGLRPDGGHALRKDCSIKQLRTEKKYIHIFIKTNDMNSEIAHYSARLLQPTLHGFRLYSVYTVSLQPLLDCVSVTLKVFCFPERQKAAQTLQDPKCPQGLHRRVSGWDYFCLVKCPVGLIESRGGARLLISSFHPECWTIQLLCILVPRLKTVDCSRRTWTESR